MPTGPPFSRTRTQKFTCLLPSHWVCPRFAIFHVFIPSLDFRQTWCLGLAARMPVYFFFRRPVDDASSRQVFVFTSIPPPPSEVLSDRSLQVKAYAPLFLLSLIISQARGDLVSS